jgi:hypothetical protein
MVSKTPQNVRTTLCDDELDKNILLPVSEMMGKQEVGPDER